MENIPVYVICYQNGWLVEETINRLQHFAQQFIVIDNASGDEETRSYLDSLTGKSDISVWRLPRNWGPRCFYRPLLWHTLPEYFAVTDPDLEYPAEVPKNFMQQLKWLVDWFKLFKAGPALDISGPPEAFEHPHLVATQAEYWTPECQVATPAGAPPIYAAAIDTTFAVYRKSHYDGSMFTPSQRVGGAFTVKHRPWYKSFWQQNAHRMATMFDGAVYSTTGAAASKRMSIPEYRVRIWSPTDPHPL